jgi:uncharacterized membrane protein YeaQ/YmgE (transglycosylase-associated protein family)
MYLFVWLLVGGVVGWLARLLIGVETPSQDKLSSPALPVSLLGASILLANVRLFNRGSDR